MAYSTRTEILTFVAVLLLALAGGHARAASVEAQAKAAVLEGRKAFDTGAFEAALAHYEEALRLKPAPGLLFNVAQCHRRLGHLDQAAFYFRRYLETNPPEAQARAVATVLQQLSDEARDAEAREAERKQRVADAERLELEKVRLATVQAESAALERRTELERALKATPAQVAPPVTTRWWFWGAIGVVVAGASVAVVAATAPQPTPTTFPEINAR